MSKQREFKSYKWNMYVLNHAALRIQHIIFEKKAGDVGPAVPITVAHPAPVLEYSTPVKKAGRRLRKERS